MSKPFVQSERLSRFLRFIVSRTLENRSEEIKEIVLATEVFDRTWDFDPKESTIVRTEAGRLRQRLDQYYRAEGCRDPIRITLPKGSYIPVFHSQIHRTRARFDRLTAPLWVRIGFLLASLCAVGFVVWHAWWRYGPFFPAADASMAVLQFRDLSEDGEEAYFADGLREELIVDLRAIPSLRLIDGHAPTLSPEKSASETGRSLQVSHVVEGTVKRSVNSTRITVRVIESSSGKIAWSDQVAGDVSTVAQMCGSLAIRAARSAGVRVNLEERRRLSGKIAVRTDAVLHFWQGMYSFKRNHQAAIRAAVDHFERAVALDDRLDWAWAMLAISYYELASRRRMPVAEAAHKAEDAANHAVALNQAVRGGVKGLVSGMLQWKWSVAGLELKRRAELNPRFARAHAWYADFYLSPMGRSQEALAVLETALELDPFNRRMRTLRSRLMLEAGRTNEAIAELEKELPPAPPFGQRHSCWHGPMPSLGTMKKR